MQPVAKEAIIQRAAQVAIRKHQQGDWTPCEAAKFMRDAGMSPELFLFLLRVEVVDDDPA